MIRRNVASQTIYLPKLSLSADNAAVISGASAVVSKDGTEAAAAGDLTHYSGGIWKYTFAQTETDAAIVAIILTASGAEPVVLNLVTTAANTAAVAFGANTTAPDNAGIAAIKVVTDRINTGLVADGLVWQFTANMLELSPAAGGGGGGGGSGDAEQATLLAVEDKIDALSVALAGSSPVEPTGRIANGGRVLAYVGDDFKVRSGTALPIPVKDPAGGLYTLLTSIGAGNLQFGASLAGKPAGLITGTIASLTQSGSGASQLCNITVEITNCGVGLKLSEDYEWQIQSTQTHGEATDSLIRLEGMLSLRRNVVG